MTNNFGITVTIDVDDKLQSTLENMNKMFDKSQKRVRDFTEETKKSNRQDKESIKGIKDKTEAMRKEEWQSRRLLTEERKRWLEEEKERKKGGFGGELKNMIGNPIFRGLSAVGGIYGARTLFNQMKEWDIYGKKIKGITHSSDEDIKKLNKVIVDVSKKTGKSVFDLQHDAFELTRTWNHGTGKISKNLESISLGAIATNSSLSETAEVYRLLDTAFEGTTSTEKLNAVAFLGDKASQSMHEVGNAATTAMTSAKAHNQVLSTTIAMVSQLGKSGFIGSNAGTAIKQIFSSLSNPSIEKNLRQMGLSFKDVNVDKLDFEVVLDNFVKGIETTRGKKGGDLIVQKAMKGIFGEASDKMSVFLSDAKSFKALKAESLTFSGEKIAKEMLKGAAGFARLGAFTDRLSVWFGERILPGMVKGFELILSALEWCADNINKIGTNFGVLGKTVVEVIKGGVLGSIIGGAIGFMIAGPLGAKVGATIGATVGGGGAGTLGYDEAKLNQKQALAGSITPIPTRQQEIVNSLMQNQPKGSASFDATRFLSNNPMLTPINQNSGLKSNTSISIDIIDKVGVQASINKVKKDDKGRVEVKQRGSSIDSANY